jgi:hypothetical protein
MATIQELYTQALLAQAAYANLEKGQITDLTSLTKEGGMAAAQAADFANKWTVVAQYDDPSISGLNATIFENMASHTRYLAIRGTEPDIGDVFSDATLIAFGISDDQYYNLMDKVLEWMSPDQDGNPALLPDANFTITGHSLGGYLAVV